MPCSTGGDVCKETAWYSLAELSYGHSQVKHCVYPTKRICQTRLEHSTVLITIAPCDSKGLNTASIVAWDTGIWCNVGQRLQGNCNWRNWSQESNRAQVHFRLIPWASVVLTYCSMSPWMLAPKTIMVAVKVGAAQSPKGEWQIIQCFFPESPRILNWPCNVP